MISRGYVDAAKVCANSGSGYNAIGATNESNWSGGILAAVLAEVGVEDCGPSLDLYGRIAY
jgi:hypothetical protein